MATDIQLKRSSVSGRVPDAANVQVGEPVVNLADKILFTKDGSGNVIVIGAGTTSNVIEGTNLYFSNARVYANIAQAKLNAFASTTSSELAGVISDETGTGALVFSNTPTLLAPSVTGTATFSATGSNSTPALRVNDGANRSINFLANVGSGSYNPIVNAFDSLIYVTSGAQNNGNLVIAPWSTSSTGIKIDGTGNTIYLFSNIDIDSGVLFVNSLNNRVGIGTRTPNVAFEVVGRAWFRPNDTGANAIAASFGTYSSSISSFYDIITDDATSDMVVNRINRFNGFYHWNKSSAVGEHRLATLEGANNTYTRLGIFSSLESDTSEKIRFDTNGLSFINTNNRLGINTASPSANLHVVGNVLVTANVDAGNVITTGIVKSSGLYDSNHNRLRILDEGGNVVWGN